MDTHTYILSIAGHDPSGGAGLTADIKTFEAHGLYGLSVCTAVTVQNDTTFDNCIWMEEQLIINQIEILFKRFAISVVKIGIIQSWETLLRVTQTLKKLNPSIKIILDPILKASAGFDFHSSQNLEILEKVLENCTFITPNYQEINALFTEKNIADTIAFMAQKTNVYLKGGHRTDKKGWDMVYYSKIVCFSIAPKAAQVFDKHGSGCVLSAALAANLTKELSLEDACKNAKYYTERFLNSSTCLLGTHSLNPVYENHQ